MANDRCPDCGAMYALVGHRHLCKPSSDGGVESGHAEKRGSAHQPQVAIELVTTAGVASGPSDSTTYRYRNAEKRRADMRDYMRTWRAKKKG